MSQSPTRLHHSAAVVRDLGASRKFYENIVSLPLTATWCESNDQLGDFCHAFFGLEDGNMVEITCDKDEADEFADLTKNRASDELERWLSGDHNTNNNLRSEAKT